MEEGGGVVYSVTKGTVFENLGPKQKHEENMSVKMRMSHESSNFTMRIFVASLFPTNY